MKPKLFELLDFPKFSTPSVAAIDVSTTAQALIERLADKSFISYGQIWPKLDSIVRFGASEDYINANFTSYRDEWKNKAIQSAVQAIANLIGGKGFWYSQGTQTRAVSGFLFKSSIRGVWFHEGRSYAVLINARKSQPLSLADVSFLARGVYELYCIDDPNDPTPMIVDLSAKPASKERETKVYVLPAGEAMSLASFEGIVRIFLEAMALAGLAHPVPDDKHAIDLLRGRSGQ